MVVTQGQAGASQHPQKGMLVPSGQRRLYQYAHGFTYIVQGLLSVSDKMVELT
jgi:hypothetical protein